MLDACGSGYELSLDLKDPRSGPAVIDAVRNHEEAMIGRLWLCGTVVERLAELRADRRRRAAAAVDRDSNASRRVPNDGPTRSPERVSTGSTSTVATGTEAWSCSSTGSVAVAFGWDMQFEHELRDGLRMGLDAVYSDHVDVMIDAMKAEIGSL